jgi:hypothetical protein
MAGEGIPRVTGRYWMSGDGRHRPETLTEEPTMAFRTHTITHRFIRRTAALAALSLATFACGGTKDAAASSQRRGDHAVIASGIAAEYRPLDEATVRKIVAIMRAWQPERVPPPSGDKAKDLLSAMDHRIQNRFTAVVQRELAERNSTATIDGTAPLKAAIVREGLSSREFVLALLAFLVARQNDDLNAYLKLTGGKPAELSAALQRNIEIIRSIGPKEELPSGW